LNFEFEAAGDGDAPLHPAPGGSQTVRSVTTGSAVGGSASTQLFNFPDEIYKEWTGLS
jgi:hypothetical protein